jgi:hypothetical protein
VTKSNTERVLPSAPMPKRDTEEPNLAKLRTEKTDPIARKSSVDIDAPSFIIL